MFATMQKVANMTLFSVLKFNNRSSNMCFEVHGKVTMSATSVRSCFSTTSRLFGIGQALNRARTGA
jgi:hypothetical protein